MSARIPQPLDLYSGGLLNYLAHLYFSESRPLAWAGALMGDFVKGRRFDGLPDDLVMHLQLHRALDAYTRISVPFQRSRRRLDPALSHGRSVIVDVFYDHFLACYWRDYSPCPLPDFAQQVYAGLMDCHDVLHPRLQQQLPQMMARDWLTSYQRPEVVKRVLERLSQRLNHKLDLVGGFAALTTGRDALEEDFRSFMAGAAPYLQQWKAERLATGEGS